MKKFLLGDVLKAVEEEIIQFIMDYGYSRDEAVAFYKKYKRDYKEILNIMDEYDVRDDEAQELIDEHGYGGIEDAGEVADALGVSITDVTGEDVDNYFDMGGTAKGELESSIGLIQWIYDHPTKAYIVYMSLDTLKDARTDILYGLPSEMMKDWASSDSMGEYYNSYIRGNALIEDPNIACGCTPNPCEPSQIDLFKARHGSLK